MSRYWALLFQTALARVKEARRCVFLGSVIAFVLGAGLFAQAGLDRSGEPESPDAANEFLLGGRPFTYLFEGRIPPYELSGLQLRQWDRRIDPGEPVLTPGQPISLDLGILPRGMPGEDSRLRLNIRGPGHGPAASSQDSYTLDSTDWRSGEEAHAQLTHWIPFNSFVGRGYLWLYERPEGRPWEERAVLALTPVFVKPVYWPSTLSQDEVRNQLGGNAYRQSVAFRLGPATDIEIPALFRPPRPPRAVAVVSALRRLDEGDVSDGRRVCRVDLYDDARGLRETGYLRMGSETSLELEGGKLTLQGELRPNRMRFEYLLNRGMFDVAEVAFLF